MKKENMIHIECNCGCGEGVTLKNDFGSVFADFQSCGFAEQQGRFFTGIKRDVDALRGRPVTSFMVQREDLAEIRTFLKKAEYNDETCENSGHIVFSWDRDFGYTIELYSRQKPLDIILGKRYRCYEHIICREEAEKMVRQIEIILSVGDAAMKLRCN